MSREISLSSDLEAPLKNSVSPQKNDVQTNSLNWMSLHKSFWWQCIKNDNRAQFQFKFLKYKPSNQAI
jgi:hypothetical protein